MPTLRRNLRPTCLLLAAGLAAAACGSDEGPPAPAPATAAVSVGNIFFRSDRNATVNPSVDTVRAGGTVTWTWVAAGLHSVESSGSPAFAGSDEFSDPGSQVTVKFDSPGTYTYLCGIHGDAMTGRVVVE